MNNHENISRTDARVENCRPDISGRCATVAPTTATSSSSSISCSSVSVQFPPLPSADASGVLAIEEGAGSGAFPPESEREEGEFVDCVERNDEAVEAQGEREEGSGRGRGQGHGEGNREANGSGIWEESGVLNEEGSMEESGEGILLLVQELLEVEGGEEGADENPCVELGAGQPVQQLQRAAGKMPGMEGGEEFRGTGGKSFHGNGCCSGAPHCSGPGRGNSSHSVTSSISRCGIGSSASGSATNLIGTSTSTCTSTSTSTSSTSISTNIITISSSSNSSSNNSISSNNITSVLSSSSSSIKGNPRRQPRGLSSLLSSKPQRSPLPSHHSSKAAFGAGWFSSGVSSSNTNTSSGGKH